MRGTLSGNDFRDHQAGSVIAGVQGALPEHRYAQSEITEALAAFPAFERYRELLQASAYAPARSRIVPAAVATPTVFTGIVNLLAE
jgi:predicted naringenin-chalcone synthase